MVLFINHTQKVRCLIWAHFKLLMISYFYITTKIAEESSRIVPPVRCELCKFHGHLSHTCSIKEVKNSISTFLLIFIIILAF